MVFYRSQTSVCVNIWKVGEVLNVYPRAQRLVENISPLGLNDEGSL